MKKTSLQMHAARGQSMWRVVPVDPPAVEHFASNYERGKAPRGVELECFPEHLGVSMFDDFDIAQRRFSSANMARVGSFLAEVALLPDRGFWLAKTGSRGHWTVWGDPVQLMACVRDVRQFRWP